MSGDTTTPSVPWWRGQEDLVISGVSGRFPESDNVDEFAAHLFAGNDLITEDSRRWEPGLYCLCNSYVSSPTHTLGYYNLPRRHGKVKDASKFDANFFGIVPKQANCMDPQMRMLHEVVYEAMVDAGNISDILRQ